MFCPARSDVFVLRSKGKNRERGSRKNSVRNFMRDDTVRDGVMFSVSENRRVGACVQKREVSF
ncbi:hypothetical protein A2841_03300 [Candidatus Kaiserbacteria bacterium RIFCSPHIGHO2_01_FULL_48_10]|uniref:Uncharacterized protein n=1 Tax=Candidatus Kaiserbacteria bacterium RIFCSPHIGHO2_01_FULL_48_10 TaxID=1798476 RepID=A0A1F6C4C4_9BACT|nr:MAG: hypothetical protein A2841_03300 [Candidatus Kaiserbacteria bacterium RIFCSPHIGHO2_01_FULL_48_10]